MTHDVIDWILGVGAITAALVCCFIAIYLPRRLSRNDSQKEELASQGRQIGRHRTEIMHIHKEADIAPFDPNWDR